MASKSASPRIYVAFVTALVVWALAASPAFAQAPPTIDAVDSPTQAFQPSEVTVMTGTTVRWEFDQAAATHSVTSTSGNWTIDETRNAGGEAVTRQFDAAGTYTFNCKFHPSMTGTVTVTAPGDPRFDVLVMSRTTGFRHTDAINAGRAAIPEMGEAGNYNVELTEDATRFTDAGLRPFEVIVFLNDDGEGILNAAQRTAMERWTQRGGGIVGIHATANADRNWAWKGDMMGGSWFQNHPDGALQFQQATVNRFDDTHPATINVPENWVREDEWYNFTAEPQNVHVLLKLDESTYVEQDGSDGVNDDHPIAWCSNYDGGRHFYTALGHMGSYWSEPAYLAHISGAIEWASGEAPGDCGPQRDGLPTDAAFDKVTLDDTTENPMELAVDPDGNVFYVELAGRVKYYNATTKTVRSIAQIPVHRGNENGLLGITLDPNFDVNHWVYLFYSAPSPEEQHISRFTVGPDGTLDMTSERILLRIPHQRIICCHSSGSLTFGPDGNLYISVGDDTQHAESQGYNPIDDRLANEPGDNPDADHARDARRSSGNTNDLRGKILRIHPEPDGTYTIPPGNLFGLGGRYPAVPGQTRPEIYTMGHRNPFRIQVDSETGWVYNGEVGPDAGGENANRGPRGYDELNQIRQAGHMGWPYCIADNKAYSNWDFGTQTQSGFFDCDGGGGVDEGPLNDSAWNTGKANTPPTSGALLWWPYQPHANAPNFPWNTPPLAIPQGPGRTAIAGPIYHFNPANSSTTKFPVWFDDKIDVDAHYEQPVSWVRRVATNLAHSRWRKLRVATAYLGRQRPEDLPELSPDHVDMVAALRNLPVTQRKAVVLHYLLDLPVAEVAVELGVADGTVKSWLHRGRNALAADLGDEVRRTVSPPPAAELRLSSEKRHHARRATAAIAAAFIGGAAPGHRRPVAGPGARAARPCRPRARRHRRADPHLGWYRPCSLPQRRPPARCNSCPYRAGTARPAMSAAATPPAATWSAAPATTTSTYGRTENWRRAWCSTASPTPGSPTSTLPGSPLAPRSPWRRGHPLAVPRRQVRAAARKLRAFRWPSTNKTSSWVRARQQPGHLAHARQRAGTACHARRRDRRAPPISTRKA